jgi:tetratricopeptide (TPR) repeat protein
VLGCEAAAQPDIPPELVSPLGHAYLALGDSTGAIAAADSVLATRPADVEAVLDAAAARAARWRYAEAIVLYDSAIALAPEDWRPWRFRGHRHVSLRRFDQAVTDLTRASTLDSLSFDVAYHLGLALYLRGEFDAAADAYGDCMRLAAAPSARAPAADAPVGFRSCAGMADVDNDRVAVTEWRWRALRRAGRMAEADALLDGIEEDMDVGTNRSYHALLLLHKDARTTDEVFDTTQLTGNQFETIGYGVAVDWLTEGDTARAIDLMRRIVERGDRWQAFGFIAAEADLVRLRR